MLLLDQRDADTRDFIRITAIDHNISVVRNLVVPVLDAVEGDSVGVEDSESKSKPQKRVPFLVRQDAFGPENCP